MNAYASHTFTLDTNVLASALGNIKGSASLGDAPDFTDSIVIIAGMLTIDVPLTVAAITGAYTITTGSLTVHPDVNHQLCTLQDVKNRVQMEQGDNDTQILNLIPVALSRLSIAYGREFMPYSTGTRTFEVHHTLVPLLASDLRSVTSIVLHPEADAPTTLTMDDYALVYDTLTSTTSAVRLSRQLSLPTAFSAKFGYEQIAVTGSWGIWDDVTQVPADVSEAAVECVLSWLNKPIADIAGIDSSNPRPMIPGNSPAWDIPTSAHRKMSPYSRNLGVY